MEIIDMNVRAQSWIQDASVTFYNSTELYFDNGTHRGVLPSDTLEYSWSLLAPGAPELFLTDSMNLNASQHADVLCAGVFIVHLVIKDPQSQKKWHRIFPAHWTGGFAELPQCNLPMVLPSALSAEEWAQEVSNHMSLSPHIANSCLMAYKPGDINGDDVVNVTDLMLLLPNFGN